MYTLTLYLSIAVVTNHFVDQLGSASSKEREAAQRALEALGSFAQPALSQGSKSDDLEISRRCEQVLCKLEYFGLARMPRIDCLPDAKGEDQIRERNSLMSTGLIAARREADRNTPDLEMWLQRRATACLAKLLVEKGGWSRSEVRKLLLEMEKNEQKRADQPAKRR